MTGEPRRPRALVVGDALVPSGMARVIDSIFSRLTGSFDVVQLAAGYTGDPRVHQWPLFPAGAAGDPNGVNRLASVVSQVSPDLVFVLQETATAGRTLARLRTLIDPRRIIVYLPLNSGPVAAAFVRLLAGLGAVVVPTRFAQQAILSAAHDHSIEHVTCDAIIPIGVDTSIFAALTGGRLAARQQLKIPDPEHAFIVLNANANRPWKAIDATIRGFAMFASGKPADVRLYLHMGLRDRGWDLAELARRCNVLDRCLFSTRLPTPPALPDQKLNVIYNACDVGISTATREGWGMINFEHAATGAAQVVPRHTAYGELWNDDRATMMQPSASVVDPGSMEQTYHVAPATVAAALERLYADREYLAAQSEAARTCAMSDDFRWDAIAAQWRRLCNERISASASTSVAAPSL